MSAFHQYQTFAAGSRNVGYRPVADKRLAEPAKPTVCYSGFDIREVSASAKNP